LTGEKTGDEERFRTLLEINNSVISNLTREPLFRSIAQSLRRVVPFDRAALFLDDKERAVMRLFMLESSVPSSYFSVGLLGVVSGPMGPSWLRAPRLGPCRRRSDLSGLPGWVPLFADPFVESFGLPRVS